MILKNETKRDHDAAIPAPLRLRADWRFTRAWLYNQVHSAGTDRK